MADEDKQRPERNKPARGVKVTGTQQITAEVMSDEEDPSLPSAKRMRELAKEKPPKGFKQVR